MGQRRSKQQSPFRRNELWLCEEAVPEEPRKRLELVDEAGAGLCRRNLPCPCRVAAQVAKQVILQKIRETEKESIMKEFDGRIGEIEFGVIQRMDGEDVIFEIHRAQALMTTGQAPPR